MAHRKTRRNFHFTYILPIRGKRWKTVYIIVFNFPIGTERTGRRRKKKRYTVPMHWCSMHFQSSAPDPDSFRSRFFVCFSLESVFNNKIEKKLFRCIIFSFRKQKKHKYRLLDIVFMFFIYKTLVFWIHND